jgi:hypothetical protein
MTKAPLSSRLAATGLANVAASIVATFLCVVSLTGPASAAVERGGVVPIDQNRALAGGVTPGDAPGFPIVITQPGSYRLAGNLDSGFANAIEIATSNVTLDLDGFRITGSGDTRGVTDNGIVLSRIVIRNGFIVYAGGRGIRLSSTQVEVSHVHVTGGIGIQLSGRGAIVRGNTAADGANGIVISGGGAIVKGNTATGHTSVGILVTAGGLVSENTASHNTLGIDVICPATVVANVATSNSLEDIRESGVGCTRANNTPGP